MPLNTEIKPNLGTVKLCSACFLNGEDIYDFKISVGKKHQKSFFKSLWGIYWPHL